MRITTWNVNGLRAALNKGFLGWLEAEQPDVVCLQEVRARPEQIDAAHLQRLASLYAYIYWNPAQRPGYSGVAMLAKDAPLDTRLGLDDERFDIEGRVAAARLPGLEQAGGPPVRLFGIYFPNGGRDLERVPYKLDFYAHLLQVCDTLHARGEQVILCGDFNTAHREIDLRNPRSNQKSTGFLPEERAWIDRYLEHGFVDVYRQLYPQRVQYTWWAQYANARANNVGWRLDYFLLSTALADRVQDVIIHDEIMGSDHCPVTLVL